jgi:predicted nucleotide-binding protein (sugar kinase/HSP70/actin superfamily)
MIGEGEKITKIGFPRGFAYYLYPGFFETFFAELGFTPVVSEESSRTMLEKSALFSETEHCLSHKIFDAHLYSLLGKAEAVFIPRLLSMTKKYLCCAKFGALPDASRCVLRSMAGGKKAPPILSLDINETREALGETLLRFAGQLGFSKKEAEKACARSIQVMNAAYETQIRRNRKLPEKGRFLLIGHSYTLGEPLIMEPILKKLRALGIPAEVMSFEPRPLPFKGGFSPFGRAFSFDMPSPIRWCTFAKIEERLKSLEVSHYAGVIQTGVFNCGADSVMTGRFRRLCAERGGAFMELMMDEHSGTAGIETRLEAFADSLAWKKGTFSS